MTTVLVSNILMKYYILMTLFPDHKPSVPLHCLQKKHQILQSGVQGLPQSCAPVIVSHSAAKPFFEPLLSHPLWASLHALLSGIKALIQSKAVLSVHIHFIPENVLRALIGSLFFPFIQETFMEYLPVISNVQALWVQQGRKQNKKSLSLGSLYSCQWAGDQDRQLIPIWDLESLLPSLCEAEHLY